MWRPMVLAAVAAGLVGLHEAAIRIVDSVGTAERLLSPTGGPDGLLALAEAVVFVGLRVATIFLVPGLVALSAASLFRQLLRRRSAEPTRRSRWRTPGPGRGRVRGWMTSRRIP